jgi:hypothetical protein
MSRALNLDASQDDVLATCARKNAAITQIETLASGGTRVVLRSADDAATIGRMYKGKVITGPVQRTPSRLFHG